MDVLPDLKDREDFAVLKSFLEYSTREYEKSKSELDTLIKAVPEKEKIDKLIDKLRNLKSLKERVKDDTDKLGTTLQEINSRKNELVELWKNKFRTNQDLIEAGNGNLTTDNDRIYEPAMESVKNLTKENLKPFTERKVEFKELHAAAKNLIADFLNELNHGESTENLGIDTKTPRGLRKMEIDSKRNSSPRKQVKLSSNEKSSFVEEENSNDSNYEGPSEADEIYSSDDSSSSESSDESQGVSDIG